MIAFPNHLPKASIGSSTQHQCKLLVADFGDGYSQRALDGLNAHRCEWQVRWSRITCQQADEIESFLMERRGKNSEEKFKHVLSNFSRVHFITRHYIITKEAIRRGFSRRVQKLSVLVPPSVW